MIVKEIRLIRHSKFLMPRVLIPAALLLLFLFWRFFVFASTHPAFFRDDYEEVYRGTVARELMLGTPIPLWRYRVDDYAGGFYVITTLLPVFHYLFGFSMLGIKAFGITQTAITLMLWYAVLARYVNQRTAIFFSLLYIFAPFRYIVLSSLVFGDHAETCFLSALTVLLFFRMREHKPEVRPLSYLAMGLLGGFSLWFAYIYGITLLALAIFALVNRDWKLLDRRALLLGLCGFLGGFSFWLIFNSIKGFSGFVIQGYPVWKLFKIQNLWGPFLSWREFFIFKLFENPKVSHLQMRLHDFLLITYVIAFALLLVCFIWKCFKSRGPDSEKILQGPVGLCSVYVVIFLFTQQMFDAVGLRFLVPLFPFALAVIAFGLSRLSTVKFKMAIGITTLLLSLAFTSTLLRFDLAHFGEYLSRRGYAIKTLGHAMDIKPRIIKTLREDFSSLKPGDRLGYILALVEQLDFFEGQAVNEITKSAEYVPESYKGYFLYLCGRELMLRGSDLERSLLTLEPLRQNYPYYYEQAVRGAFGALLQIEDLEIDAEEMRLRLRPELAAKLASYEGFRFAGENFGPNKNFLKFFVILQEKVASFDSDRRTRFLRGVGSYIFQVWMKGPDLSPISPKELRYLPMEMQEPFFDGIGLQMFRTRLVYYSTPLIWTWNEFVQELDQDGRKELLSGVKYALERWGLPDETIPWDKLKGTDEFL